MLSIAKLWIHLGNYAGLLNHCSWHDLDSFICFKSEVFTLLHEFLWNLPNSKWKVGIPWNFNGKQLAGASAILVSNSMEILTFFQGIPMEMVRILKLPVMIPMGITIIYIVKNSYNSKNRTLGSRTHHMHRKSNILTAAP